MEASEALAQLLVALASEAVTAGFGRAAKFFKPGSGKKPEVPNIPLTVQAALEDAGVSRPALEELGRFLHTDSTEAQVETAVAVSLAANPSALTDSLATEARAHLRLFTTMGDSEARIVSPILAAAL